MRKMLLSLALAFQMIFMPACNVKADLAEAVNVATALLPVAQQVLTIADPALGAGVSIAIGLIQGAIDGIRAFEAAPTLTNLQKAQAAVAALQASIGSIQPLVSASTDQTVKDCVAVIASGVESVAVVVDAQTPPMTVASVAVTGTGQWKGQAVKVKVGSADVKKTFNAIVGRDQKHRLTAVK